MQYLRQGFNVHVKYELRISLESFYISTFQFPGLIEVFAGDTTTQIPFTT